MNRYRRKLLRLVLAAAATPRDDDDDWPQESTCKVRMRKGNFGRDQKPRLTHFYKRIQCRCCKCAEKVLQKNSNPI